MSLRDGLLVLLAHIRDSANRVRVTNEKLLPKIGAAPGIFFPVVLVPCFHGLYWIKPFSRAHGCGTYSLRFCVGGPGGPPVQNATFARASVGVQEGKGCWEKKR